ncbi:hypothetical protein T484DRAFT_1830830 [Baffinella frigidus]|nr:hypothetical protein T484DRAFT_1830830 [Cryptophyta sp. CCMP2293]
MHRRTCSRVTLAALAAVCLVAQSDAFRAPLPLSSGRMRSGAAIEMKSSSNPPPSLPELLQRAVKALAPPIIGACLAVGMPLAAPAELSAEQKLVAQAWTTVDASYVDRTFNNQNWMGIRQKLVKAEYASREEAYQAISEELLKPLGDTYTRFITPLKYETLRKSIVDGGSGQDFSGIGVELFR